MKKINFQKGFTLTEMIVVIAIFVLIVTSIYSAQNLSQRLYHQGEEKAEILQNGRVILERMVREIRQAREIVTDLSYDESGATSSLEFEDGHIPSRYYYIRYYIPEGSRDLNRQYRVYCTSSCDVCTNYLPWDTTSIHPCILEDRTIGEYLKSLGFWDPSVINVSTTLEKGDKRIHFKTKVFGRNL